MRFGTRHDPKQTSHGTSNFSLYASIVVGTFLLSSCQLPRLHPLDDENHTTLAAKLHEEIRAEGIAPATVNTVLGGSPAFPSVNESVGLLLQRLAGTSSKEEKDSTLRQIGSELRRSADYSSPVRFCTARSGARVMYRLIQDERRFAVPELTNSTKPYLIGVGIYHIWTERNGNPTSSTSTQFLIARRSESSVVLEEAGERDAQCR